MTKYGCSILSQRVGCKGFGFECKNGLTQIVVSLFFLYMALIALKERHFLSRERSCRFWLLSLRIECRLLMQLKLNPTVYCALLSTSLYMTLYITLVNTKMPAELYHGPLRSQENLLCDMLPIPSYRAGTLILLTTHSPPAFQFVRNNPPRVITIPFHCHTTCSGTQHTCQALTSTILSQMSLSQVRLNG